MGHTMPTETGMPCRGAKGKGQGAVSMAAGNGLSGPGVEPQRSVCRTVTTRDGGDRTGRDGTVRERRRRGAALRSAQKNFFKNNKGKKELIIAAMGHVHGA